MSQTSSQLPVVHVDKVIDTIEDLVQTTLECEKKGFAPGVSFVEITKQLAQLKLLVDQLGTAHNNVLKALSIDAGGKGETAIEKMNLKEPDRKLLTRLEKLRKQCEEGRDRVYAMLQEGKGNQTIKDIEKASTKGQKGKEKNKATSKSVNRKSKWLKT